MPAARIGSKWTVLAAALLAVVGGCTGGSRTGKPTRRIILISNSESPFWDAVRAGVKAANDQLKLRESGLEAVMEVTDGTPEEQLALLRQFGTQSDVAGVAVSVAQAANVPLVDEMKKLREKGVAVIAVDADVDREKFRDARLAFVGTDNWAGGAELGTAAKNLLPEGGGFVTFVGVPSSQNAIERIGGFTEGAGRKFTALDSMADEVDQVRMRENVHNAILNHGEKLQALVGIWSQNAPAIVDVVRQEKNRDRFKILAFDAEPKAIQAMGEGDVDVMVVQNPYRMGFDSVRLLAAVITGDEATKEDMLPNLGQPNGDIFDTGLKIVVPDEGTPLVPEMFTKAKFFKLSAFRQWLKENNLTGS